ncbi:MAG: hypothetical protein MUO72_20385 [Bacteroidales bacterium]|nr:hypothetical protein [Bacteroidales bacterium]
MTKNLFIITGLVLLIVISCDSSVNSNKSKTSHDSDTTGYYAARDLNGIGELKLLKTTKSIIVPLEKTMNVKSLKVKEYEEPYSTQYIVQLIADTTEKFLNDTSRLSLTDCSYCNQASIYKIHGLSISNTLIDEIYLTFYKDTLIQIFCDFRIYNADIIKDAFEFKYGKYQESSTSNTLLKELTRKWQNNKIIAELSTTDHFNKNMGYVERATLKIKLKGSLFAAYLDCDNTGKTMIIEKAKKLKNKKMKQF